MKTVHLRIPGFDRTACGKAINPLTRYTVNPSLSNCRVCLASEVHAHIVRLWAQKEIK